jgi:Fe2+ or Zn2+ uptake regulation protein
MGPRRIEKETPSKIQQSAQMRIPRSCAHTDLEAGVPAMSNELAARALERLREEGRRVTTARRMVLEGLGQTDAHVTADILARWIQHVHPEIHLSTVYRTLDSLCEWGFIIQIRRPHGAAFFHLAPTHQHIVCEVCGRIEDVPRDAFADLVDRVRDHGFELDIEHAALVGRCGAHAPDDAGLERAVAG